MPLSHLMILRSNFISVTISVGGTAAPEHENSAVHFIREFMIIFKLVFIPAGDAVEPAAAPVAISMRCKRQRLASSTLVAADGTEDMADQQPVPV